MRTIRTPRNSSNNRYTVAAEDTYSTLLNDRSNAGFYFPQVQAYATLGLAIEIEEVKGILYQIAQELERLADAADRMTIEKM